MTSALHANLARILHRGSVVGTGVVLAGGWLATCAHVVAAALTGDKTAYTETPMGEVTFDLCVDGVADKRTPLVAVLEDCVWGPVRERNPKGSGDYALLRIACDTPPPGLHPFPGEAGQIGAAPLFTYGFPEHHPIKGNEANLTLSSNLHGRPDGLVALYPDGRPDGFIQPGFSGAPVFRTDLGLNVLGLVKSVVREREFDKAQAFFVPGGLIVRALNDVLRSEHSGWRGGRRKAAASAPAVDLEMARAQDLAARLDRMRPGGGPTLEDAVGTFAEMARRKRDRLPEPYNQGYLERRALRLQRDLPRIALLEPDRIGEYVHDLLRLAAVLEATRDPEVADELAPVSEALSDLVAALDAPKREMLAARGMTGDGEWPPNTRLAVRRAAEVAGQRLEGLAETPNHANAAMQAAAEIGFIEDQTYLDRPAWPVMARNAASAAQRLEAAARGAFDDLIGICGELRRGLHGAQQRMIGALPAGAVFRDLPDTPDMVVIPACPDGFLMGSPKTEPGRDDNETQHVVRIPKRFALGRYAVTFEEFDAFCAAKGREPPGDEDWGRGRRPVVNVSWNDATTYCEWLRERIGARYRLLSEAEWEYACRGDMAGRNETPFCPQVGTTGEGQFLTASEANFNATQTYNGSPSGERRGKTVAVDHHEFSSNTFFVCQMHGNVWEWCEDIFAADYSLTPDDGRPHLPGENSPARRVVRGGSLDSGPQNLRSALRSWDVPGYRNLDLGFRVAKTLFTP